MSDTPSQAPRGPQASGGPPRRRRPLLKAGMFVFGALAITFCVYEFVFWLNHVYEPNARVQANFVLLSSPENAIVEQIMVARGDRVAAGDVLAVMDSALAELEVTALEAEHATETATRRQVEAEFAHFTTQLDQTIETEREAARLLAAERDVLRSRLALARSDVERSTRLLDRGVASEQRRDEANDRLLDLTGRLRVLDTGIRLRERKLAELQADRLREAVYRARLDVIDRRLERLDGRVRQARKKLDDMTIRSPLDGFVNEIFTNEGKFIEDGDDLLLLHAAGDLWLEAHIDETAIRFVRVGQVAKIEFEAYPWQEFEGRVQSLGAVTLSNLALTAGQPTLAATPQRIPIRIELPNLDRPLWPGMRAAVNIVID